MWIPSKHVHSWREATIFIINVRNFSWRKRLLCFGKVCDFNYTFKVGISGMSSNHSISLAQANLILPLSISLLIAPLQEVKEEGTMNVPNSAWTSSVDIQYPALRSNCEFSRRRDLDSIEFSRRHISPYL